MFFAEIFAYFFHNAKHAINLRDASAI